MLTEIVYWLLNMSIAAVPAGLCVLLLRAVPRIPRRVCFALWVIPLIRLWMPILPGSQYSLMKLFLSASAKSVPYPEQNSDVYKAVNMVGAANGYFPVRFDLYAVYRIFEIAGLLWLTVSLLLLSVLVFAYVTGIRDAGKAKYHHGRVYVSGQVSSAAVYGIFKPRILISPALADSELGYILRHEEAHIRRLDNLWRMVALLTAAVHWFNPFVWLFLKCFFTDMEQACDEAVLQSCSGEQRREYAAALLDSYESRSVLSSAFGGGELRTRIGRILTYRKMSMLAMLCLAVLAAALSYVLLTNPA